MVCALVFVRGTVNAVDNPTRQSFVIELVGAERVVNAVSLNSVIVQSARIVGPASAGAVIAFAGVEPCFALNALSFVAMLVALAGMNPAALRTAAPVQRARGELRAALRHVHGNARAVDPAGHDGAGRDAVVQLPGPHAAARQRDLARHGGDLRAAHGGDGGRLGGRRAGRRCTRARLAADPRRRRRWVRRPRAGGRGRAVAPAPGARAHAPGRDDRDLLGRRSTRRSSSPSRRPCADV